MKVPKYNTITHGKKCLAYEVAKLCNSVSTIIKDAENIQQFKILLKTWDEKPCICRNCIICAIDCMQLKLCLLLFLVIVYNLFCLLSYLYIIIMFMFG